MSGHIFIVAPSAYPLGGVATWLDYLIPGLRQRGWRVTLALTEGLLHNVDAYLAVHPIQDIVRVQCRSGTREGRVRSLCAAIRLVQPDIVAAVNIAEVYSAVNRLKRTGAKVHAVMTVHGIESDYYEQIKTCTASLDAVVATNRLACKLASSIGELEGGRIYHAPYGVALPAHSAVSKSRLAPFRIGFVGRLEKPQKRVDELLAIIRELDRQKVNYRLSVAGSGPDEKWLRAELTSNIKQGTVTFLGALSSKEVENLYDTIDALLITSRWETGPIVAWEAMARRVLVVTSAYIGSRLEGNLRHEENCLIYPIGNVAAAVKCLVRAQDVELRCRLASAAAAFVSEQMTHEQSVNRWSQCFADIKNQPIKAPSFDDTQYEPTGRLDRLLGTRCGETVRQLLHRKALSPAEPGHEWPHASGTSQIPAETFWDLARAADVEG
jgi:glycosyltransferase involved in cell wall biosynthesis